MDFTRYAIDPLKKDVEKDFDSRRQFKLDINVFSNQYPRIKFLGSHGTKLDNMIYHNQYISVNHINEQKGNDMQNVKFFDKNGVELKVGDVVCFCDGKKRQIVNFSLGDDSREPLADFDSHDSEYLDQLTKHTSKLVKVKRTFEEVCELRDSGAMFKRTDNESIVEYKPTISMDNSVIYIRQNSSNCWLVKPKGSDVWEDAKYKEVEE